MNELASFYAWQLLNQHRKNFFWHISSWLWNMFAAICATLPLLSIPLNTFPNNSSLDCLVWGQSYLVDVFIQNTGVYFEAGVVAFKHASMHHSAGKHLLGKQTERGEIIVLVATHGLIKMYVCNHYVTFLYMLEQHLLIIESICHIGHMNLAQILLFTILLVYPFTWNDTRRSVYQHPPTQMTINHATN